MIILPLESLDAIVITAMKLNDDGQPILDLPFPITGQIIYQTGKNVTYSHDVSLDKKEVMAWICYDALYDSQVKSFSGYLDPNEKIKPKYQTHFPFKNSTLKATTDENGNIIPYNGSDKDDYGNMCEPLYGNTWGTRKDK